MYQVEVVLKCGYYLQQSWNLPNEYIQLLWPGCMCPPLPTPAPKTHAGMLTPNVMVLVDGAIGK